MSDVFISYVEEDALIALAIARGLNSSDYSTWRYEENNSPGTSYLQQIGHALDGCQAVVPIISNASLASHQVAREIEISHELRRPFVPVLNGISHVEFQNQRPSWWVALGTASTIHIPPQGVSAILPRIVQGLQQLGVKPSAILAAERAESERRKKEEAEAARKAKQQALAEKLAREKAEAERRAAERAEAQQKAQEHTSLGAALYGNGDLDGAISEYREALHLQADLHSEVQIAVSGIVESLDRKENSLVKFVGALCFIVPGCILFASESILWGLLAFVGCFIGALFLGGPIVWLWGVRPFRKRFPPGCAELPIALSILSEMKDAGREVTYLLDAIRKRVARAY